MKNNQMKNATRAVWFNIICGIIMSIVAYACKGLNLYTVTIWGLWVWIIRYSIHNYVKTKKTIKEMMRKGKKDHGHDT